MFGNTIEEGEQGWYYLWWRGIHLLCGEEGKCLWMAYTLPVLRHLRNVQEMTYV